MFEGGVVDVHHHFVPEEYRDALERSGNQRPDGIPAIPAWSERQAIDFLDQLGIETAFVSISSPGVRLDGCDVSDLARVVNRSAAELIAAHPGRFGGFATLPLPDVDSSLQEIEHALDELGLDGVAVLTNYGGTYLGDPALDDVFDELNRRRAVVFVHPTSSVCCEQLSFGFPSAVIEFIFDTTRAVTNLIYSGTFDRCPDLSWIIPHAGAALPLLAARLDLARSLSPQRYRSSEPVASYLGRLHYDMAGPRSDDALRALLGITDPSHLLYGSDWPFTPVPLAVRLLEELDRTTVLDREQLDQMWQGNARRLLPRPAPGRPRP
jgi:predicted TIM-barrel fold metal-dependent hydrolase